VKPSIITEKFNFFNKKATFWILAATFLGNALRTDEQSCEKCRAFGQHQQELYS